jgi:nucleolar protein 15
MPSKHKTSSKPSGKQKREMKKNRRAQTAAADGGRRGDFIDEDSEYADKTLAVVATAKKTTTKMKPTGDFVALPTATKTKKKKSSKPRVIYVGSLPHGFYEEQMRSYFGQFGDVLRVKVSRNKKTGKSKHYAFVEFKHAEVASIVAESMDNYLLGNHVLKVKLMRPEDVHPETFKGVKGGLGEKVAERSGFKIVPWNKRAAEQHNKKRGEKGERNRLKKLAKKEKERMKKIKESGIDYDFEGGYEKKLAEKMKDLSVKKTTETKKKTTSKATTTTKETKKKAVATPVVKKATTKKTTETKAPKKTPAKKKVEKIDAEEEKEDAKPTPRTARRNRAEARGKKREAEAEEAAAGTKKTASKRTKK